MHIHLNEQQPRYKLISETFTGWLSWQDNINEQAVVSFSIDYHLRCQMYLGRGMHGSIFEFAAGEHLLSLALNSIYLCGGEVTRMGLVLECTDVVQVVGLDG